MNVVEIVRLEESEEGTFGILKINKEVFCCTLEPQDKANQTNASSIPAQQYICKRTVSPRHGDTFSVTNVPERLHVLFHAGNIDDHTAGCILLGQYFGKLKGNRAVLNSGITFEHFLEVLGKEPFHLTIQEHY